MNALPNILVVDDDPDITHLLSTYLQRYRLQTCTAHDAASMRQVLRHTPVDLIVLDLMLPGEDGMTLAREVRAQADTPIIMLTARASACDRVLGLETGADDYLTKPFEPRELVARIQCVLRRTASATATGASLAGAGVVLFDGWQLNRPRRHLQTPTGTVVPLSDAEYRLLNTFINQPHALLTRDQLLEQARGKGVDQLDRSIDLLVSRVRHKLTQTDAQTQTGPAIKTVRGAGYMFVARTVSPGQSWN